MLPLARLGVKCLVAALVGMAAWRLLIPHEPSGKTVFSTIVLNDKAYQVEVAKTDWQRQNGLMGRPELPHNQGMWFVLRKSEQSAIWMKNTLIPLDVIFFDSNGRVINQYRHVQPCKKDPCAIYPSNGEASFILELAAGEAEKSNIQQGDLIKVFPR